MQILLYLTKNNGKGIIAKDDYNTQEELVKNWVWILFVTGIMLVVIHLTNAPLWVVVVIFMPILTVSLVFGSVWYNFRSSLEMEDVPKYGYAPRLKELENEASKLEALGFRKIDQFYFKTIPDSISFVLKHEDEPIYFLIYHFGQKYAYDFLTRFEREYYLTTSSAIESGLVPRPEKSMLQIYPNMAYHRVLEEHRESFQYIKQKGIGVYDVPEAEFRYFFLKNYRDHAAFIKKLPFWPIALIIRTISRPGKAYCKRIKEQYPNDLPQ